jgi:hypothetical protein
VKAFSDDGADEEDVDRDVIIDVDPATVEREAKILRAAKHVVMARAQRKLFQQAIRKAREDSASSKDTNDELQQISEIIRFCRRLLSKARAV